MTQVARDWVRLPTVWIQRRGLVGLRWRDGVGANNIAALMTLVAIAHRADDETGTARVTYDEIEAATNLSRAKISAGLKVLVESKLITRGDDGRSSYGLVEYDRTRGWGKLPARKLYENGKISAFAAFKLRSATELNALKLFLLFVERRDNSTNLANISYDKIEEYTGIDRTKIKSGISLLAANNLVHVEQLPSGANQLGIANAYRIPHIEPYIHMGTRGRGMLSGAEPNLLG